jgi:hypothetical protein
MGGTLFHSGLCLSVVSHLLPDRLKAPVRLVEWSRKDGQVSATGVADIGLVELSNQRNRRAVRAERVEHDENGSIRLQTRLCS